VTGGQPTRGQRLVPYWFTPLCFACAWAGVDPFLFFPLVLGLAIAWDRL
jgi:hypothetical protein